MNTLLSALLLWESEARFGSGTFRRYKQLTSRSQRLYRDNQESRGKKSQSTMSKNRGRRQKQQDPALKQTSRQKQNNNTSKTVWMWQERRCKRCKERGKPKWIRETERIVMNWEHALLVHIRFPTAIKIQLLISPVFTALLEQKNCKSCDALSIKEF